MDNTFQFYSEYNVPILLGRKAKNIGELLDGIRTVPGASIYYHTHRFLKQHHFLIPELPNDFAYWLRNVLNLRELGELTSSVNIVECENLEQLRSKFVAIFENFNHKEAYNISCAPGYEFQFMSCKTFSFQLPLKAKDLKEFKKIFEHVSIYTFYYHIFESRLRKGKPMNDIAEWFKNIGENELSEKVSNLDPYTMTLEELRKKILNLMKQYGKD
jgi:Family of unknown function (DUF5752)